MWQEELLQSYRTLHLGLQSLFSALIGGFALVVPSAVSDVTAITACFLSTVFWIAARLTLSRTSGIVTEKSEDVSAWERNIILSEAARPEDERNYSRFKLRQRAKRITSAAPGDGTVPAHAALLNIMQKLPSTLTVTERTSALQTWDALIESDPGRSQEDKVDLKLIAKELLEPGKQVSAETISLLLEVSGKTRTELDKGITARLAFAATSAWLLGAILLAARLMP
jgi:hypothetical protein